MVVMILLPALATRVHIRRVVNFEAKNNNAQLALLALLSAQKDGKPIYQIISEYISFSSANKPNIDFLRSMLDNLITSKCYKLYYLENGQEKILASSSCTPKQFKAEAKIVLPFGSDKLFQKIYLVID
ncbi:MAG: hypothetical protein QW841_01635 [Candidatus Aenigmatarchaeota archaeon]